MRRRYLHGGRERTPVRHDRSWRCRSARAPGNYRPAYSHAPWAAYFRAVARGGIEAEGYRIVVNMGDQPGDLAGGHAKKAVLLPNPFYRIP